MKFKPGDTVRLSSKKYGLKECAIDMSHRDGALATLHSEGPQFRCPDCPANSPLWNIDLTDAFTRLCWPESHMELVESAKEGAEAPREETAMSEMHTWSYELVVPQKLDEEGNEVRAAGRIAFADALPEQPKKEDLLVKHARDILDKNATGADVSVNIRPFLQ